MPNSKVSSFHPAKAVSLTLIVAALSLMAGSAKAWNAYEATTASDSRPLCVAGILNGNKAWMTNEVRSPGLMTTYWLSVTNRTYDPLVFTVQFTLPGTSLSINETVSLTRSESKSLRLGMIYKDPAQAPSPIMKADDIFKYIKIKCTHAMGRTL
jgi:hypothetical protein